MISTVIPAGSIEIEGVNNATISEYFISLNHGEFMATANLFAVVGCLHPPFDNPIQGRKAIAQYLAKEAQGMRFCPEAGESLTSDLNHDRYQIQGTVATKWFAINVCWLFELNAVKEIVLVEIKLLATLPELLNLAGTGDSAEQGGLATTPQPQ